MIELRLSVNIDYITTLRNARGTVWPDPVQAAFLVEQAGANSITVHLREDRRPRSTIRRYSRTKG